MVAPLMERLTRKYPRLSGEESTAEAYLRDDPEIPPPERGRVGWYARQVAEYGNTPA